MSKSFQSIFLILFVAEAVVVVADAEVDSVEAVVVVVEDSMVVAVAADQPLIRKIVLPPQVCVYVFYIFGFFCLDFFEFFCRNFVFRVFYSIFR